MGETKGRKIAGKGPLIALGIERILFKRIFSRILLVLFLTSILAVAVKIQPVKAGVTANVEVIPASYNVPDVGLTFDVNIIVVNVENLYGWALKLYYPNNVLNGTLVMEEPFLKTGGVATAFITVSFTDNYNATYGVADLLCTREGNVSGVDGNGTLATITFTSTSTGGPQTLHLADVWLSDSNDIAIPFTAVDGEFTVITPPAQVYYSVEPVAISPLTDINASINGLETPPTPSPVGQEFTVAIKLYNVTTSDVPLGVAGLEVHLGWNNTLIAPVSFVDDIGQPGGVLSGTILYAINPGFFDEAGNVIATAPYTNATQFEVAAASTSGAWWGDGAEVANITFHITGQPSSPQPDFYSPLQLTFVDVVDKSADSVPCYVIQGTIHIDASAGQSPPFASFSYSPLLPSAGESITFDASSSSPGWNGTQTIPIVSYAWDFGDNYTATGQIVAHAYADSGNYTVTLNVTDSEGLWLAEQRLIQVGPPHGAVAEFTASPETGRVGEAMDFDASSSIEGWNGTNAVPIIEYLWDFGDGNVTSTNESTVAHAYASPGTFNVTLTTLDAEGMYSSCSANVSVVMSSFVLVATSSTSALGSVVGINGTVLDAYGNGLGDETVVLFYTFAGANAWYPISSGVTDSLGDYYVQWLPPATGYFTIEAECLGNTTYSGTSDTTTLSTLPYQNQYVFSVESNSTISGLAFNTTDSTLSFTASGPSGTTGYTKVTVAKSLVANPANIAVYLDGNQTQYSITSADDSWLLILNYTHSTHHVLIDLNTEAIPEFPQFLILPLFMIATLLAVMIYRKKDVKTNQS